MPEHTRTVLIPALLVLYTLVVVLMRCQRVALTPWLLWCLLGVLLLAAWLGRGGDRGYSLCHPGSLSVRSPATAALSARDRLCGSVAEHGEEVQMVVSRYALLREVDFWYSEYQGSATPLSHIARELDLSLDDAQACAASLVKDCVLEWCPSGPYGLPDVRRVVGRSVHAHGHARYMWRRERL